MGHGLARKAQMEVGAACEKAQNQVCGQGGGKDSGKSRQQPAFAEENHIADSPHHAQPCPLGQSAHDEPGSQADEKGGMQGAGAASCPVGSL